MTEIKYKNQLIPGTYILWDNIGTHRETPFGPFTVCVIHDKLKYDNFLIKFPDNDVPQNLPFNTISNRSKIIDIENYPEYFI